MGLDLQTGQAIGQIPRNNGQTNSQATTFNNFNANDPYGGVMIGEVPNLPNRPRADPNTIAQQRAMLSQRTPQNPFTNPSFGNMFSQQQPQIQQRPAFDWTAFSNAGQRDTTGRPMNQQPMPQRPQMFQPQPQTQSQQNPQMQALLGLLSMFQNRGG